MAWAAEKGIVKGIGDNKCAPNQEVTYEQMSVMLVNYVKCTNKDLKTRIVNTNQFVNNASISNEARFAVTQLKKWGLYEDEINHLFRPQGYVTRGETAAVLTKFIINSIK